MWSEGGAGIASLIDVEGVVREIERIAREARSEEDLRLGVESILKSRVLERLGDVMLSYPKARYEVTLVSRDRELVGKVDALHGYVVIEYKKPGAFGKPGELRPTPGFRDAVEQVKRYIWDLAGGRKLELPKYFGVVLDGYKIGFVWWSLDKEDFEVVGRPPSMNVLSQCLSTQYWGLGGKL